MCRGGGGAGPLPGAAAAGRLQALAQALPHLPQVTKLVKNYRSHFPALLVSAVQTVLPPSWRCADLLW